MSLAHVAAGRYIGYVEAQMNTWNCLAGQVLIKEARGSSVVLRSFLTISGQWRWKLGITDPLEGKKPFWNTDKQGE